MILPLKMTILRLKMTIFVQVATGKPSIIPEYVEIRNNFLISNYGAGFGVDNDDTSSYLLRGILVEDSHFHVIMGLSYLILYSPGQVL